MTANTKSLNPEAIRARHEDILFMKSMGESDERIALRIDMTLQQVQKIIQKYG